MPPTISVPLLLDYDKAVQSAFWQVIGFDPAECSAPRTVRAALKMTLPATLGCGLFKVSDFACVAWWTSVASCLADPLLFQLRDGLSTFADGALSALHSVLGGANSKFCAPIRHWLPATGSGLVDGSLYAPCLPPVPKLNKVALRALGRLRLAAFKEASAPARADNFTLTNQDVVMAAASSSAGSIFAESLKNLRLPFAFGNIEYIAFVRYFLGLPPVITIGSASTQPGYDYKIQTCAAEHKSACPLLDAHGDHAASGCPATKRARYQKHSNVIRVLAAAAREADLKVLSEPDTFSLLQGQFSREECRRVFPKHTSKKYDLQFAELLKAIDMCDNNNDLTPNQKQSLLFDQIEKLPALKDSDMAGLRIDLSVEDPATGEVQWVDGTVVHTTSPSYISKEVKHAVERELSAALASEHALPDVKAMDPSPILLVREAEKTKKYSKLVSIACKQATLGKRTSAPAFVPFVVADSGELSPAARSFQEWIILKYKQCHKRKKRSDGLLPKDLTRAFRHKLYVSIQFAIAAGMGSMLLNAGQPWRGPGAF